MAATTPPVTMTLPSGKRVQITLNKTEPGIWRGSVKINELGLYRLTDGILSAVTAAGPLNPKEVADMRATDSVLAPSRKTAAARCAGSVTGFPAIHSVAVGQSARGNN